MMDYLKCKESEIMDKCYNFKLVASVNAEGPIDYEVCAIERVFDLAQNEYINGMISNERFEKIVDCLYEQLNNAVVDGGKR